MEYNWSGNVKNSVPGERGCVQPSTVRVAFPLKTKANLIIIDDAVHIQKVILQGDLMVDGGKLL